MIFIDIKTTYQFDWEQKDPKRIEILGIGVKIAEEIRIWDGGMLTEFIEWFSAEQDMIIVGFNILKYDIPLLLLKASSVNATEKLYNKIFRSNIVDLFVILTFLNKGKIKSLKQWCKDLNVYYEPSPPELHKFDEMHLKSELESLNLLFNKLWNSKLPNYDLFALKDSSSTTPIGIAEYNKKRRQEPQDVKDIEEIPYIEEPEPPDPIELDDYDLIQYRCREEEDPTKEESEWDVEKGRYKRKGN
jgi:hypothetical protein